MTELFLYIMVVVIATLVVWVGSDVLEGSSKKLAKFYNLPPVAQGTIILAIGSSFPEFSTAVIATIVHDEFDLGISAIIGSAIFNILVIPGLVGVIGGSQSMDRNIVYKDAQFYILSVAVLLLTFSLAVNYYPIEGEVLKGYITRPIALIPVALYLLYLFLQHQDTVEFKAENSNDTKHMDGSKLKEWLQLLSAIILITVGVEALVRSVLYFGDYFETPNFLWGVTVLAVATSVPDAFVSVKAALRGDSMVSMGNVLGSNIFDLLIAVPAGVLIIGASEVNFSVAVPMMLFLIVSTILLFAFLRTKLSLSRGESWVLLAAYGVFLAWVVLESFEMVNLL